MRSLRVSRSGTYASLLLLGFFTSSAVRGAGAGILIFTEIDEARYVLLADHKKSSQAQRGWSILSGTVGKNETLLDAAVREVLEESNGAFDEQVIREITKASKQVQANGDTLFFAGSRFQPAAIYNNKVAGLAEGARGERGPFAWVPWSVITESAIEAEQLGNDCAKSPVMIPPEYLPTNRQTSWYSCWFLRFVLLIERNGGLSGYGN